VFTRTIRSLSEAGGNERLSNLRRVVSSLPVCAARDDNAEISGILY
jgi:hypothetical protein